MNFGPLPWRIHSASSSSSWRHFASVRLTAPGDSRPDRLVDRRDEPHRLVAIDQPHPPRAARPAGRSGPGSARCRRRPAASPSRTRSAGRSPPRTPTGSRPARRARRAWSSSQRIIWRRIPRRRWLGATPIDGDPGGADLAAGHRQPERVRAAGRRPRLAVDGADQPIQLDRDARSCSSSASLERLAERGRGRPRPCLEARRRRAAAGRIVVVMHGRIVPWTGTPRGSLGTWRQTLGQLLGVGLGAGEQVADARRRARRSSGSSSGRGAASGSSSSSQRDRRARRARRGAGRTAYGATSVLMRRVLGVVEPGPALAGGLGPLPRDEVRDGRPDRPREPLDPVARLVERVAAARSGSRPGCRACRSSSGSRGRRGARARSGRAGRASSVSSQVVFVAGVDVDERERRRSRARQPAGPGVDLEAAWLPSQHSVATRSATRWSFASRSSRSSTPVSCQRVSHVGRASPGCPSARTRARRRRSGSAGG